MNLVHPDENTFHLLEDFIAPYEEKCVLLSSHIRRRSEKIFIIVKHKYLNNNYADGHKGYNNEGAFVTISGASVPERKILLSDILGILYIDSTLFHCIPETNLNYLNNLSDNEKNSFANTIFKLMNGKKIKCISGEARGTDFFIKIFSMLSKYSYQINSYELMTIEKINKIPDFSTNGSNIIRCTVKDIDELFELQKKYLREEVAPKGKIVSDLEVSMSLRQILKNQLCLSVISNGEIVAKANTNAIGINWVQIGGVYTFPNHRRNGYAINLVYRICKRALKLNKKVALFVKENNIPAINLYKGLGFQSKDFYKIAYYF